MNDHRTLARIAGALYLLTFVTSIPALALKLEFFADPSRPLSGQIAVVLEILLALSCIGTALALYPIGRQSSHALALGFVASRTLEAATIFAGTLFLMAYATAPVVLAPMLIDLHDAAFLIGPGLLPAINALFLATLLYRMRLIPRIIPVVGLIGAPLLLASATASILGALDQVSTLAAVAAAPIALWEFSLGAWLLIKAVPKDAPSPLERTPALTA